MDVGLYGIRKGRGAHGGDYGLLVLGKGEIITGLRDYEIATTACGEGLRKYGRRGGENDGNTPGPSVVYGITV
jgi:hypothetical protein